MSAAVIEQQAAEWLAAFDAREALSPETDIDSLATQDGEFASWVNGSIERRVAFLRLVKAWRDSDRIAALNTAEPQARPPRRGIAAAAAAAALAVAIGLGGYVLTAGPFTSSEAEIYASRHETATGEREIAALPEGSRIELNTASRISVRIDEERRSVRLLRGEAYFDVGRDPARPFTVDAGAADITVLGTRFAVDRREAEVRLRVLEGEVRVQGADGSAVLRAGNAASIRRDGAVELAELSAREMARATAWRRGRIYFEETPLREAAAEFNRYNEIKLFIDDQAADIRIGGNFRTGNVDGFAALLSDGLDLEVERSGGVIYVSR